MTPLVVVACGKQKRAHPAPALELYTGGYFRASLAYARTLTPETRIVVLSGKYGLVRGRSVIAPYEMKLGQPGAVGREHVLAQAHALGIVNEPDVIGLVGETSGYAAMVRSVWPHARFPLAGLPGRMGGRKGWMLQQVRLVGGKA